MAGKNSDIRGLIISQAILVTVVLTLLAILLTTPRAWGQKPGGVRYHEKLQKDLTYESALETLEVFKAKSLKEDIKKKRKKLKQVRKRNSVFDRNRKLAEELERLRKEIESEKP